MTNLTRSKRHSSCHGVLTAMLMITGVAATFTPSEADARRRDSTAIFPLGNRSKAPAEFVKTFETTLTRIARTGGIDVMPQSMVHRRVKKPGHSVDACGWDKRCLVKLARRAHTQDALFARVSGNRRGTVTVEFRTIVVANQSQVRQKLLRFTTSDAKAIEQTLIDAFDGIFGVAYKNSGTEASDDIPLEELPLAAIEKTPTQVEQNDKPGKENSLEEPALTSLPPPAPEPAGSKPKLLNFGTLSYVGFATAGAGLIATGVGVVFGLNANSARNDITPQTTQLEAVRLQNKQNHDADRANVLMGVGATTMILGASLWLIDTLILSRNEPATRVETGGAGTALLRW